MTRIVTSLLAVSGLTSCILLVSPEEYGSHCRFEGSESACGRCFAENCRSELDDCCAAGEACGPGLRLIEACASGDTKACSLLESDLNARDPHRVTLAQCVSTHCRSVCTTTSVTSCDATSFGRGQTCRCNAVSSGANDVNCSEERFPGSICCAPEDWPEAGQRCTCRVLSCAPNDNDGCTCRLAETPTASTCTGTICCQQDEACSCGSTACGSGAIQVETCTNAVVGCPPKQKRVTTCSARVSP